ncbi:DUF6011 domain-containing protein [Mycolicibacter kumamotonensis]|uniref:DUF6011 domain-containing protein n=1 Tax=Mycolicibacter kumamotonensis TaxID=354243 RepID=UPI0039B75771
MTALRSELDKGAQAEQAEATCRCENCRRPLTHPISVALHRGPVCRQRAGVVV